MRVNPDDIIRKIKKKLGKIYFEIPKMMEIGRCAYMKEAEEQGKNLTMEETKEAFRKAKEKGHVVGGEWFKEGKDGDS